MPVDGGERSNKNFDILPARPLLFLLSACVFTFTILRAIFFLNLVVVFVLTPLAACFQREVLNSNISSLVLARFFTTFYVLSFLKKAQLMLLLAFSTTQAPGAKPQLGSSLSKIVLACCCTH